MRSFFCFRLFFSSSTLFLTLAGISAIGSPLINYSIEKGSLQEVIDAAPPGSRIVCERWRPIEMTEPVILNKSLTLDGLNARLPVGLGQTSLIEVTAEGVTLVNLELHGNYDSVDQDNRAALINIYRGNFRVERCWFFDSSKDGVQISPVPGATEDISGGVVRDITAFRLGRDAVSISGGVEGRKIRNVTVDNVSLIKGYLRGAVEISDGTDNIVVRNVYAEDCVYAVDVQDHRRECASNTNVTLENIHAVNCKHIVRTANSERGHAGLTLRNVTGQHCELPVYIHNTESVSISSLKISGHTSSENPPIRFRNCQNVVLDNVEIESVHFATRPITQVEVTGFSFIGMKPIP